MRRPGAVAIRSTVRRNDRYEAIRCATVMMTLFERAYLCSEPFLPPLYGHVRRHLRRIAAACPLVPEILDVGGRKSHYTIGVRGQVTVTDLPRETLLQEQLRLGLNPRIIEKTRARRSNVR